jgi:hypothetical protein
VSTDVGALSGPVKVAHTSTVVTRLVVSVMTAPGDVSLSPHKPNEAGDVL